MMRVLLSGFEPFGGEAINASWEAVAAVTADDLRGIDLRGIELRTLRLPVRFGAGFDVLAEAIAADTPDVVLAVGEAASRADICVERFAVNLDDARIADNGGCQPAGSRIADDGPAAYGAGIPAEAAVAAMRRAGIPARLSDSAGTFVCNHVFYRACRLSEAGGPPVGFIHVPQTPAQALRRGGPSLATPVVAEALRVAIACCAGLPATADGVAHAAL